MTGSVLAMARGAVQGMASEPRVGLVRINVRSRWDWGRGEIIGDDMV